MVFLCSSGKFRNHTNMFWTQYILIVISCFGVCRLSVTKMKEKYTEIHPDTELDKLEMIRISIEIMYNGQKIHQNGKM